MTAIIIGASSGLGRALAVELARRKHDLLLVASERRDVEATCADLRLRHGIQAQSLGIDLGGDVDAGARLLAALERLPPATSLLLPIGVSRTDDDLSLDAAAISQLLAVNLNAPLTIVHALLPSLLASKGTVVLFGSVAAQRGRGRNVAYAAAKRGLTSFAESLRQRYKTKQLRVQLWQLGFLKTNLTHGMKLPLPALAPEEAAREVVDRLGKGSFERYLPSWWWPIIFLIRRLPWFVYRRMKD
ncbi:MAG: SDR family NAD(P)-dependent oxidoreductase [Dokdonella sp.]